MANRKPSQDELDQAMVLAHRMCDKNRDKYRLGATLLYYNERNKLLEDLQRKAEYYMRFGQGEKEHRDLRRSLDVLREMDVQSADDSSLFTAGG